MKKKLINDMVYYDGLNSLAEVLESCMDKYSSYNAITDKYNNIHMTYGELKEAIAHFASGLVIYWTLSNILSIIQQRLIMRKNGVK